MAGRMSRSERSGKSQDSSAAESEDVFELPFETSIGYQVRMANRAIQRALQSRIEPYGVTPGMWYFLRALWEEDGLTQRELSQRVGTMEPTTLTAIATMEKAGFVTRRRNPDDRRRINIRLTDKGRRLRQQLLPLAIEVLDIATKGLSPRERDALLIMLRAIQANLESADGATASNDE
jgi:MarR family transcriptional regulator, organic hydroperoxide resistance regulator